jgi:hypothetical protein
MANSAPADIEYWEQQIRPRFQRYDVDFIGEIGDTERSDFLGGAAALLFPIDFPGNPARFCNRDSRVSQPGTAPLRQSPDSFLTEHIFFFFRDPSWEGVTGETVQPSTASTVVRLAMSRIEEMTTGSISS